MTRASVLPDRPAPAGESVEMWNTRALVAKHKVAALVAGVLLALLLVIVVGGLLTSRPVTVSDSTTCTSWGSTSDTDQLAYARLYVREHGPLAGGVTDPAQVVAAINNGCGEAYVNDVEDNVNVVQALHP